MEELKEVKETTPAEILAEYAKAGPEYANQYGEGE